MLKQVPKCHPQQHMRRQCSTTHALSLPEHGASVGMRWEERHLFPGLLGFWQGCPHMGTGAGPWVLGLMRNVTCHMSALTPETPARGSPNTCRVAGGHGTGVKSQQGQELAGKPQARPKPPLLGFLVWKTRKMIPAFWYKRELGSQREPGSPCYSCLHNGVAGVIWGGGYF